MTATFGAQIVKSESFCLGTGNRRLTRLARREATTLAHLTVVAALIVAFSISAALVVAQESQGTISGLVSDPTGALIPNAQISALNSSGVTATAISDERGVYALRLSPGQYQIEVSAAEFESSIPIVLHIVAGQTVTRNFSLAMAVVKEQVRVSEDATVETEPASNASAITLRGSSLETLSDDRDDLAEDLAALAGPSAGPEGGEIYVDGFSGGKLPPKSSIREIRVNQNPFSAEYDRVGFGRIEILTKPGADNFHGDARFNFGDSLFYAKNPFAAEKPDFQRRIFEGTVTGPLKRKASFTLQFENRNIGQTAVINAIVLDPNLSPIAYRNSILNPTTNTEASVRLDYQLSENHTLTGRYEWERNTETNAGLDSFSLPSTAYNVDEREHLLQLTETAILNPTTVHDFRFQYRRSHDVSRGLDSSPTVSVPDAFTGGGSTMGLSGLTEDRFEIHDMLSLIRGQHTLKFGGRVRIINESNRSMENYNGFYLFSTVDAYRITETGLRDGLSPSQIRGLGGGASQFALTSGNPVAAVTQVDAGLFIQDDWRLRKNLTLSAGLRFEKQNNINDWRSWAPRVGMAWAPRSGTDQPLFVLRAGLGLFYERIRESLVLDTKRLNGISQQEFLIPNPDSYPYVPSADELSGFGQQQVVRVFGDGLRAPFVRQFTFTIEKEFFKKLTVSSSYVNSHGVDSLRSENTNAFLPGTYDPFVPDSGIRPLPGGNIYAYQSNGRFSQNQFITNVNAKISKRFNMQGYYAWGSALSDTDGAQTFPANLYDLSSEYGRAGYDVGHRAFISGSFTAPLDFVLSPFIVAHSGGPFDITTGDDYNGDSIFNDRPAWATDLARTSVVQTRWGAFDTRPQTGQVFIPRNLGTSPGMFAVNLRLSKSFGFGPILDAAQSQSQSMTQGPPGSHGPGGGHGGHHDRESSTSDRNYTITFSAAARNLFNRVNLDTPVGNLSSPVFGKSTSIHGFGHGSASANRTLDFQVRFSF